MADINAGFTFSGTNPNNICNASNLNALVGAASIQPAFVTAKTLKTAPVGADTTLIVDSVSGTLMKAAVSTLPAQAAVSRRNFTRLALSATATTRVAISWQEIVLRNAAGLAIYFGPGNTYADLTTTPIPAVDGRDFSGTVPNCTWLYFFVVSDGTSNTWGLISQCTGTIGVPDSLPSGVTYYCLVGAMITTSTGGDIVQFYQQNCEVMMQPPTKATVASNATQSLSLNPWTGGTPAEFTQIAPDTAGTFQTVNLANCIPPSITSRVRGMIGSVSYSATMSLSIGSYLTGTSASPTATFGWMVWPAMPGASTAVFGFENCVAFDCAIAISQQLSWTSSAGSGNNSMRVTGFTLNL